MVWACFSWYGVGPLFRIKNTMNAVDYKTIMEEVMLPYAEEYMPLKRLFQQDNDPKHTSKMLKSWFDTNKVAVLPWPSQSPDLNPIENLWNELEKKLSGQFLSSKDKLWEKVQDEWYSIQLKTCQVLVDSMPRRVHKVLQNNDGYTGY